MIPSTVGFLDQDFEIEEQPSKTYKMNLDGNSVQGFTDGQDAMKQMIFRTLNTERYQYIIYPWWYGIETLGILCFPVRIGLMVLLPVPSIGIRALPLLIVIVLFRAVAWCIGR